MVVKYSACFKYSCAGLKSEHNIVNEFPHSYVDNLFKLFYLATSFESRQPLATHSTLFIKITP